VRERARAVIFCGIAAALFAAPAARADAKSEARDAVRRGLQAFARGDAAAALAEYEHAEQLVPDANLPYRYAAEALAALERWDEAIASLERYLAIRPDVSDADAVRARIIELRERSARAKKEGTPRAPSPTATTDGSTPAASPAPAPAATRANEAPPARADGVRRTWSYVALGTGGAVIAATALLDAVALGGTVHAFHQAVDRGDPSAVDEKRSADRQRTIYLVTYVAGAAFTAVGAILLLWPSKPTAPAVTGWLDPRGGGVSYAAPF
jgi:tetratricopeptide (TPR) repeat protein